MVHIVPTCRMDRRACSGVAAVMKSQLNKIPDLTETNIYLRITKTAFNAGLVPARMNDLA